MELEKGLSDEKSVGYAIHKPYALNELISSKGIEMEEGGRVIEWLKGQFAGSRVVKGLSMYVSGGYVHIVRRGWSLQMTKVKGLKEGDDVITEALMKSEKGDEGLKHFKWQYGKPIDYEAIKYAVLHNDYQKRADAEMILAQEYLVALQPEPLYVMWTVKKLIECWYADEELMKNVRKVKVLINLYRGNGKEEYNKEHGVLPIIVVYPRYGIGSAEVVIKKLLYYFWKHKTVGWACSQVTYFIKVDNLVYYTNGLVDLKMYHRNVLASSNDSLKNDTFSDTYVMLNEGKRVEYVPLEKGNIEEVVKGVEEVRIG